MYKALRQSGVESYYYLGPSLLYALYYTQDDSEFYWAKMEELEADENFKSDSAALRVYSRIVQGSREFSIKDKAVIYRVYQKKDSENNHELAGALQCLIAADDPGIADICKEYLSRAHQREAEMFFIWLSDNKKANAELIRDVLINGTVHFNLTYEIERCLNKVLIAFGSDVVFNYFLARYDHKIKSTQEENGLSAYDFMPDGNHSHLFDHLQPFEKEEMFRRSISWFLTLPDDFLPLFFGKDLLTYLQPSQLLGEEMYLQFKKLILPNMDAGPIARLLETLSVFHSKNEQLINLVVELYQIGLDRFGEDTENLKLIRGGCYHALTTIGTRVGIAGQPFQQDIELENLLQKRLYNVPEYEPEYELLKSVVNYLKKMINRFNDDDDK